MSRRDTYINLYGVFRQLNADILDKYSKDESSLKFYDFFLFHMTSLSCGIIYEVLQNESRISTSQLFMCRCLIEDLAVMKMYFKGKIANHSEYLLRGYNFSCELNIYNKFKNLDGKYFDLDEIKKNEENYRRDYKDIIKKDFPNVSSKKIYKTQNLAFLEDDYKYLDLIDTYIFEYKCDYIRLSAVCHASDIELSSYEIDDIETNFNLFDRLLKDIFEQLHLYYGDTLQIKQENTLLYESQLVGLTATDSLNPFFKETASEIQTIYSLAQELNENYLSINGRQSIVGLFLYKMADEIEAIGYDYCYGFSDNAKVRMKPIFELVAMFHYLNRHISSSNDTYKIEIIKAHTALNIAKAEGDLDDSKLKQFYSKKLKMSFRGFKKDVNKELVKRLGYENMTSFVNEMIDSYAKDEEQNSVYKLIYSESQYFSHGNGYSLISNPGSFRDVDACVQIADNLLAISMEKYYTKEEIVSLQNPDIYRKNVVALKKCLDSLNHIIKGKNEMKDLMKCFSIGKK